MAMPQGDIFYIGFLAKTFKNLLMNHWPECIDVWHGASLGPGYSSLLKLSS